MSFKWPILKSESLRRLFKKPAKGHSGQCVKISLTMIAIQDIKLIFTSFK